MKTFLTICFASFALAASAQTPFTFLFKLGGGAANTNVALMSGWPPAENTFTVVGSNIVYAGSNIVLTPDVNGAGTNQAYAGSYRVFFTNLNFGFFVTIADTTNLLPLSTYVTGAPVFYEPINYYSLVTNWLSFGPATNTFVGIISVLGYTPPTNTYAGLSNVVQFVIATNGGPIVYSQLPYTPPTNTYAGISNVVGFIMATNGGAIAWAQMPYTAPSNNLAGIIGAQGYISKTNDGYIGVQSPKWTIVTNGFICFVSYQTNNDPGSQLTNLPMGSMMLTTNGQQYNLSNIVWRLQ